jgi:hypothetical protein
MSRHVPANFGEICLAAAGLVDELAMEHDDEAVGEFKRFVEVLTDPQHRGAAVARRHDLGVNLRHRGKVEPEAGIGGDPHLDIAAKFARQHRAPRTARCTLHVAARQREEIGVPGVLVLIL